MKLVQFGAGSIGRSFIGQIFSRAGWEVVFVDIDRTVIDALNARRRYRVVIKDRVERTIDVENVRGVHALDIASVSREVADADLLATAVGQGALPGIMRAIAAGLVERRRLYPERTLDIVICENMRDSAAFFKAALKKELELLQGRASGDVRGGRESAAGAAADEGTAEPGGYPLDRLVGFVETSIGKMVPIMSAEDRARDPLLVYAEEYNTLILDRKGFKGPVPPIPELDLKDNMRAYVDRKLFIHNLGHAVLSYVSFVFRPAYVHVWEAVRDGAVASATRAAMRESGRALVAEYPEEFDERGMEAHIEDLLGRFANRALGDTIYRAGRDLRRKLAPDDRLLGAIRLCSKHRIEPKHIALGVASALFFKAADESGRMFEGDRLFHEREIPKGFDHVMRSVCRLEDPRTLSMVRGFYEGIRTGSLTLETASGPAPRSAV